jgi:iron complex outermembrane receptor protein
VAAAPAGGPVTGLRRTAFDPSVAIRYEADVALSLRAAAYKAFRAPGLNNLYRSFGSSSISIANPRLEPETLKGLELGADWKDNAYAIGATLFKADVKNVVASYAITAATPVPSVVQNLCGAGYAAVANAACPGTVNFYSNGQDQRAAGIELDGHWEPSGKFSLTGYLTYTSTHYTRTTTGDPTGVQLALVPRVVSGATLRWRATGASSLNADVRYSGGMTLSSLSLAPAMRQGGYTVLDVGLSHRIDPGLELTSTVANLGNRRYTDASASNAQGISLALPRVVSLGLRWHL